MQAYFGTGRHVDLADLMWAWAGVVVGWPERVGGPERARTSQERNHAGWPGKIRRLTWLAGTEMPDKGGGGGWVRGDMTDTRAIAAGASELQQWAMT